LTTTLSREAEFLAGVFLGGPGALLSHEAAVELLGLGRGRFRASLIDHGRHNLARLARAIEYHLAGSAGTHSRKGSTGRGHNRRRTRRDDERRDRVLGVRGWAVLRFAEDELEAALRAVSGW